MNKGQASIEALLILAAVLIAVASLQVMGRNTNETTNAVAAARKGVNNAITELAVEYGDDISIDTWDMNGDNLIFHLFVQGNPPPSDALIENTTENSALNQLEQTVGGDYGVTVVIERVTK